MTDSSHAPRLSDAAEFEDAIRAAAEYHNILPDLVRKDYWVTRDAVTVRNTFWGEALDADAIDLRASPALNPTPSQIGVLAASYDAERAPYYRELVQFDDIMAQIRAISELM